MDTSEHGIKGDPRKQAFAKLTVEQKMGCVRSILDDFTKGLGSDPAENQRIMHERMGLGCLNKQAKAEEEIVMATPESAVTVVQPANEGFVRGYSCVGIIKVEYRDESTYVILMPGNKYTIMIPGAKPIEVEVPNPK